MTLTFSDSLLLNVDVLVEIFRLLPIRTRFVLRETCKDFIAAVDKLWKAEKFVNLSCLLNEHRIYLNGNRGKSILSGAFLQHEAPEFERALKFLGCYAPNLRKIDFSGRERLFFEKSKAATISLDEEVSCLEYFPCLSHLTFYGITKISAGSFQNVCKNLITFHLDRTKLPNFSSHDLENLFQNLPKLRFFETWRSPAVSRSFLEHFPNPENLTELSFDSQNLPKAGKFLEKCTSLKKLEFSARSSQNQSDILSTILKMRSLSSLLLEGFTKFTFEDSVLEHSNLLELVLVPGSDLEVLKLEPAESANIFSSAAEKLLKAFANFRPNIRKLHILNKYPIRNCEILEVLRKFIHVEDLKLQIAVSSHNSEFFDEWIDPMPLKFLWFEIYQFGAGSVLPKNLQNFPDLEQLTLELDHDDPRFPDDYIDDYLAENIPDGVTVFQTLGDHPKIT